jgi:hypothetical protein
MHTFIVGIPCQMAYRVVSAGPIQFVAQQCACHSLMERSLKGVHLPHLPSSFKASMGRLTGWDFRMSYEANDVVVSTEFIRLSPRLTASLNSTDIMDDSVGCVRSLCRRLVGMMRGDADCIKGMSGISASVSRPVTLLHHARYTQISIRRLTALITRTEA